MTGDSLHDDLLGSVHDDGRNERTGHGKGGWTRKFYNRNHPQGSTSSSGSGRPVPRNSLVREGTSYAVVVSPPKVPPPSVESPINSDKPSADPSGDWVIATSRRNRRSPVSAEPSSTSLSQGFMPITGSKRPHSPTCCNHCLRTSHKTAECRHLLTCKRCGGAGHLALQCRVELPSPLRNRRARPNPKVDSSSAGNPEPDSVASEADLMAKPNWQRTHISISLTQETAKLRKELSKVAVIDVLSGQTNEETLLNFLPGALNTPRVEAVHEYKDDSFLATLSNADEVSKACKIGELNLTSKMGPCILSIKPWSAEIGSVGSATNTLSLPVGSTTLLGFHAQVSVVDQPFAASSATQNSRDGIHDPPSNEISPHGDTVRGFTSSCGVPNGLGSTNLSKINPLKVDQPLPGQDCNIAGTDGPPDDGPIIPLNSEIAQPDQAVTNLKAITSSHQSEPIALVARDQLHDEAQVHGHAATENSDHDIDPFCNPDHPPENYPLPPNFSWIFMHGCWSLVPIKYSVDVANKSMVPMDLDKQGQLETGLDADPGLGADPESGPQLDAAIQEYDGSDEDRVSLDCPEDSESDFEGKKFKGCSVQGKQRNYNKEQEEANGLKSHP